MARKDGNKYYPKKGENRTGISYDGGRTYHKADYSPSDMPLGSGLLDEAAKALRKTRKQGMGADKHREE